MCVIRNQMARWVNNNSYGTIQKNKSRYIFKVSGPTVARVWNPWRSLGNIIFCSALSRHSKGGKLPSNVLLCFSFLFIIPSLTFFSTKDRKSYHVDSETNVNHLEGLMCGLLTWMRRCYRPASNDVLRREHIFSLRARTVVVVQKCGHV